MKYPSRNRPVRGRQPCTTGVWSSAGTQRAVQIERRADQGEMVESLRQVPQGLATMPGLFRIEAEMVGETEHPLENQSRLLEPRPVVAACPGQCLDQPKRADVEGAFLSRQPIHAILDIVSVHQAGGGQTVLRQP